MFAKNFYTFPSNDNYLSFNFSFRQKLGMLKRAWPRN